MKASELIEQLTELIKEHGDRHVYSQCDWDFVRNIDADTDQQDLCVVAPADTADGHGKYKAVDVFTLTA